MKHELTINATFDLPYDDRVSVDEGSLHEELREVILGGFGNTWLVPENVQIATDIQVRIDLPTKPGARLDYVGTDKPGFVLMNGRWWDVSGGWLVYTPFVKEEFERGRLREV